ncbi:glycosyltransferase family 4 protein [Capnocytophaga canimorsus]|uniref:glycosyltransferase family 4 protein n=1 Tax=Capnocytophaga canimorsus TaxID=28188 RepID=UPI001EDFDF7B|nr:glycosyltransferase family 4 protein [Capnocytophaga canimorsus]GJQ03945.1 hypothetical protein CAPN009_03600 [Capnocytophaga canimorsus]
MKIVHLCLSSFYIDDYSYQENMLPKYHHNMGFDVTVIASLVSFDDKGKPCLLPKASTYKARDGYKVIRLDYCKKFRKINSFIRRYEGTIEAIEREKPDILFIHDFSFADILGVMRYAKKNKVKVYIDCHTDYINSAKSWVSKYIFHHTIWRIIGKYIQSDVCKFYGVTPLRCDFLRDAYKIAPKKIEFLRMGVDDLLLEEKKKNNKAIQLKEKLGLKNEFVILTGGKIDFFKNTHLIIEAFKERSDKSIPAKLIVFGTLAPEVVSNFQSLLEDVDIIFVGWLSSDEILEYFLIADLIVFPGTHSVLWEQAVGVGVPSLFKYWEGMTHVGENGNAMFLYKDSVEEIKNILETLLVDGDKYNQLLSAAKNIGNEYCYSVIAKKAIELC